MSLTEEGTWMKLQRILTPNFLLVLFIVVNLIIGALIAPDYGLSTDEPREHHRSSIARRMYAGEIEEDPEDTYRRLNLGEYYGTAITIIPRLIEEYILPDRDHSKNVIGHYVYFVTFQIAVAGIYLLAGRFFDKWTSLGIALLFGTQPLLFGHGFINPKDTPLMAVFLMTVAAGFNLVDRWNSQTHRLRKDKLVWQHAVFLLILGGIFFLIWFPDLIYQLAMSVVTYSYNTAGESLLGILFKSVTTAGSLEGYQTLALLRIDAIYPYIYIAAAVILPVLFIFAHKRTLFNGKVDLWLFLAAAVWGIALSTRVLAIAAGGIVGVYALAKLRERSLLPLAIYTATASLVSFLTWPFLWVVGWRGYVDALTIFSDFPRESLGLFEGKFFPPTDPPAAYLPKLMVLQFTEPLVVLALVGVVVATFLVFRKKADPIKFGLLLGWFLLPLLYTILRKTAVYSNFRQYFFITPPLFIFAGFALQSIAKKLKHKAWIALICLALSIPAIVSLVRLHPYQYIYYNQFTGGVSGANRVYNLDYWVTAYQEAFEYANENLPPDSTLIVPNGLHRAEIYARDSFEVLIRYSPEIVEEYQPDYAIISSHRFQDQSLFPDAPIIHTVEVEGAPLMVIKDLTKD